MSRNTPVTVPFKWGRVYRVHEKRLMDALLLSYSRCHKSILSEMVEFMVVTCLLTFSEMAEPVLAHTGAEVKSEAGQRQFDHHEGFIPRWFMRRLCLWVCAWTSSTFFSMWGIFSGFPLWSAISRKGVVSGSSLPSDKHSHTHSWCKDTQEQTKSFYEQKHSCLNREICNVHSYKL